jgi:hypothetical protein
MSVSFKTRDLGKAKIERELKAAKKSWPLSAYPAMRNVMRTILI